MIKDEKKAVLKNDFIKFVKVFVNCCMWQKCPNTHTHFYPFYQYQ